MPPADPATIAAADEQKRVGAVGGNVRAALRPPHSLALPSRLEGVLQRNSSNIGVEITRGHYSQVSQRRVLILRVVVVVAPEALERDSLDDLISNPRIKLVPVEGLGAKGLIWERTGKDAARGYGCSWTGGCWVAGKRGRVAVDITHHLKRQAGIGTQPVGAAAVARDFIPQAQSNALDWVVGNIRSRCWCSPDKAEATPERW